jgi:hypothetical protein
MFVSNTTDGRVVMTSEFSYNEKKITMYGFLLFLESIPLPKACASHIEKILSKSPET